MRGIKDPVVFSNRKNLRTLNNRSGCTLLNIPSFVILIRPRVKCFSSCTDIISAVVVFSPYQGVGRGDVLENIWPRCE